MMGVLGPAGFVGASEPQPMAPATRATTAKERMRIGDRGRSEPVQSATALSQAALLGINTGLTKQRFSVRHVRCEQVGRLPSACMNAPRNHEIRAWPEG